NPQWLRYYLAAKLNAQVEDIDFNPDDFITRVNSDLVGKYVNIASRCAGFISKLFDGKLSALPKIDPRPYLQQIDQERSKDAAGAAQATANGDQDGMDDILAWFQHKAKDVARAYEAREFCQAMRLIMHLADVANRYIAEQAPWKLAKDEARREELHQICSVALNLFRQLTLMLKPVIPVLASDVEQFLRIPPMQWADMDTLLPAGHEIGAYQHLLQRVDVKQVDALFEVESAAGGQQPAA